MRHTAYSKIILIIFLFISFLSLTGKIYGQTELSEEHKEGMKALSLGKLEEAEKCFKQSIRSNRDAASFNQLGLIFARKQEIGSSSKAVENLKQAALREPGNMKYRIDYANYLVYAASASGMEEYERLISKNPNKIEPLLAYGSVLKNYFFDWKNAKRAMPTLDLKAETDMSYYAQEYFDDAENCFRKALKLDSSNSEALLGLGMLYEGTAGLTKSLEFIMQYLESNPKSKEGHLYAGMLLNRMDRIEKAEREFKTAFNLMGSNEKEEYTYTSAIKLLEPKYEISKKNYSRTDIEEMIARFWNLSNPVIISDYNERVIEHYSRMVYANFHYSTNADKSNGWKTDKGELILRFGLPISITVEKMYFDPYKGSPVPQNEVWNFNNARVTFISGEMHGMFRMKIEYKGAQNIPQKRITSFQQMKSLSELQFYLPRVNLFKLPVDIYCFKNPDVKIKEPDAYIVYQIPTSDSIYLSGKSKSYAIGLYEFDNDLKALIEKKDTINEGNAKNILKEARNQLKIDSYKFSMPLCEAALKFEILRNADTCYFSYQAISEGNKFYQSTPDLSDIVLASQVESGAEIAGAINRGNYSILPNIKRLAKNTEPVYIYYEVYDLKKTSEGLTDFTQTIRIKEYSPKEEDGSIVGTLVSLISGDKEKIKELNLTSSYKTQESSPQQFVQIDFNNYPTGTYEIFIKIKDNVTSNETEKRQVIGILNEK